MEPAHIRRRRHAQIDNPIPARDTTGKIRRNRRTIVWRPYCSLERNWYPDPDELEPDDPALSELHQPFRPPVRISGQVKTPTATATAIHVAGNTTQNQGNPGSRPSRSRRGQTIPAASSATPTPTSTHHAMDCRLRFRHGCESSFGG